MQKDSPLANYLKKTRRAVVLEEIISELESQGNMSSDLAVIRQELEKINAAVAVPLLAEDRLIGVLTLGEKTSHEMYTDDDIDFLNTVSNQLAVGLERARLHQEMIEAERRILQADKLASLGTAAAGIVHEIKNPLAIVEGMSEAIVNAFEKGKRETIEDYKKVVPKELKRINNLVRELLAYSKPLDLNMVPININDLLNDILKMYEAECDKKNIVIENDMSDLPPKRLDFDKIKQVFINLILNAIQAMPGGGKLVIRTYSEDGRVAVEIRDTGVGVKKDDLKKVFDPFYSTKEKGTGLGLAVAHKIVKAHHGDIAVDSSPGSGTVFTVSL